MSDTETEPETILRYVHFPLLGDPTTKEDTYQIALNELQNGMVTWWDLLEETPSGGMILPLTMNTPKSDEIYEVIDAALRMVINAHAVIQYALQD